ncbi:MAG: 6-carboxytetrahydropterin synthase [Halobacteriovoraceae bacterium]|nr:6-carboxytetrahydropterin synthase [Halobacteriovoraceae bacterium]MCB9095698.1 6-carboxytetrahydropterin synthase [Halobacteriovoraceae bacterium]
MGVNYSIKVYKQYFNFASSHFLIFENGTREPLHGHNYRVAVRGEAPKLTSDMVFDFLDIKPIVREVCDSLDHRLLLPRDHRDLKVFEEGATHWKIVPPDEKYLIIPKEDVIFLPIENTSAERLAIYLCHRIKEIVRQKYQFEFTLLEVEVEETPGQSAVYCEQQEKEI